MRETEARAAAGKKPAAHNTVISLPDTPQAACWGQRQPGAQGRTIGRVSASGKLLRVARSKATTEPSTNDCRSIESKIERHVIGVRPKTCRLAGMPPESSLYSMSVSAASACLCITTSCIAMRGVRVPRLLAAPLKKLPCSCTRLHNAGLLESPVSELMATEECTPRGHNLRVQTRQQSFKAPRRGC